MPELVLLSKEMRLGPHEAQLTHIAKSVNVFLASNKEKLHFHISYIGCPSYKD